VSVRQPTVEDVARHAGVSRQTVSNVLNSPAIVRSGTRERVESAIRELGYTPSMAARRLRTNRSETIGIPLDPYAGGISGVILDRFVHALTEQATPRGLRILVYAAADAQEELARLRALREGGEIDRVVLTGTYDGDPRTAWLHEVGLPFVAFGRPWSAGVASPSPGHAWVDVDGAGGVAAATRHARTYGRRVAFLGWPRGSGTGDDRERGWREEMGEDAVDRLRLTSVDSVAAARTATERALAAGGVDAVVCASDTLAVGAHLAASHAGRPEFTVVGFDNTPVAEALGISSVEQRPELVAAAVLDLLVSQEPPESRLIEPVLVVRTPVR